MKTNVSSLGQGPGLAWKRSTSSFPTGSLAELQEWTGGKTEPVGPSWPDDLVFQQWNTVGWAITDDGVLCIKPWEGDAGETGPVTSSRGTPWDKHQLRIKKLDSIGTIVLNASSAYLFSYCSFLTDLTALKDWDVSNVTDMHGMFYDCSKLTDLTAISDWDVSKVTNTSGMFSGCSNLTDMTPLSNWNVSNVTNMSGMFYGCSSLTDLTTLANWNVSNVTNMVGMFQGCSNLTDLSGLANWNVSNVTNMGSMFQGCSNLTDLSGLANWGVYNVTNMSSMFYGCSSLTDLRGLERWRVYNVTNMSSMFYRCSKLTDMIALVNWDVSNVTSMNAMFYGCSSLQRIGIPSIANGGQKLVENAEAAKLTTVLPSIVSEDESMGPYTWDELYTEITTNPAAFQEGAVWVKAEEAE